MFRLMLMMFAYLWSAILDTEGGGTPSGGSGESGEEGSGESVTLTTEELTSRTNKAAEDKASEIAQLLGVEPDKIADTKALIEAGRKAQDSGATGGSGDNSEDKGKDKSGEDKAIEDKIAALLKPFTDRLEGIEQTEQQRQQAAAEQTRTEKLDEALQGANVREDRLEAARAVALANGVKLNDKGELEGSKEAIEATKKALPEAFRGDGDDGKSADGSGKKEGDKKPANLQEALTAHYSKS